MQISFSPPLVLTVSWLLVIGGLVFGLVSGPPDEHGRSERRLVGLGLVVIGVALYMTGNFASM